MQKKKKRLRITEQGHSLSNSSQLSPFYPPSVHPLSPPPGTNIHRCGFSDRTVMALHKQIVAMQEQ